jgi:hypothetical protein
MNAKFIQYLQEPLYEYANLDFVDTGLKDIVIHVYSQGDTKVQHGPRIKVSNVYGKFSREDNFVIDITNKNVVEGKCKLSTKEYNKILEWIDLNRIVILKYWNSHGEMLTRELYSNVRKL